MGAAAIAEQATLEGLEAPAPLPDVLPRLALHARLGALPHVFSTPCGTKVFVDLLLQQRAAHHPRIVPLHVRWLHPDMGSFAATHHAATKLAARLQADGEACVIGRGLEPRHHQGADVLHLVHCDALGPAGPQLAAHTPTGEPTP